MKLDDLIVDVPEKELAPGVPARMLWPGDVKKAIDKAIKKVSQRALYTSDLHKDKWEDFLREELGIDK